MAKGVETFVRQAVIVTMKADVVAGGVASEVPAARIYPPQRPAKPVWPFVAYGVPVSVPLKASGLDGSEIDFAVHAYAGTAQEGMATVGGDAKATAIGNAVKALLDGATLDLVALGDCPFPAAAHISWISGNTVQDSSEADEFHAISQFRATIVS